MLNAPVGKILRRMAIPAIVGLFFNTMFNVTDTFYTRFISPDALAGLGFSFPIYLILIALGVGLGNAAQALSANALGAGDRRRGAVLGLTALSLTVLVVLVVMAAGLPLLTPIVRLMGASGTALTESVQYSSVILYGLLFFALNAVFNGILSSRGDTKSYRNFLIIGFFANLAFDPVFILVFDMGTAGIALATVLVQLVGTVYLGIKVRHLRLREETGGVTMRETTTNWRELLSHAVPVSLNVMTVALGVFVINFFLTRYGADAAVAGYNAAIRVEQVFLLPIMGLNTAVVTLVGQNNGAGRLDRVKAGWATGQKYGVFIMLIGFAILFPFRSFWVGLFSPEEAIIRAGSGYLSVEVFAMFSYVFLNMGVSTLQGLRKPGFIFIIGLARQIILPPVVFYLLGDTAGLGVWGVWWGLFIIPTLSAAVTALYTRRKINTITTLQQQRA